MWVDHGCRGVAEADRMLGEDGAIGPVVEDVLCVRVRHADENEA